MELTFVIISSVIVMLAIAIVIGIYFRKLNRLNRRLERKDKELEEKTILISKLEKVIRKQDEVLDMYRQNIE